MEKYSFDGCRVGTKDKNGDLLLKQWTLASNSIAFSVFSKLKCKGDHVHGSSRGKDLKQAENYTYQMTDLIHKIFKNSQHHMTVSKHTSYACPAFATPCVGNMATSATAGVPAFVHEVCQKNTQSHSLQNRKFWQEELVNLSYRLVKSQVIQAHDTEQIIEGMLAQFTSQSVLSSWSAEDWKDTILAKLAQLSDDGLARLGAGDTPMSKVFWVVVSDSGLIAISGGRKNRMKYEMDAEFQLKKPAHVEKLFYIGPFGARPCGLSSMNCEALSIKSILNMDGKTHKSTRSSIGVETSWLGRMA